MSTGEDHGLTGSDTVGHVPKSAGSLRPDDEPGAETEVLEGRLSMLVLVVLAGLTLRLIAALIGAAVGWDQLGGETKGQMLGSWLVLLGSFGDGQGVALLLAALGLVLFLDWRAQPEGPQTRLRWRWLEALFVSSAAGSAAVVVGNTYNNAGLVPLRFEWSHILSTGGFSLSYLLIGIAGASVCHLQSGRRSSDGHQVIYAPNPYDEAPPVLR